MPDETTTAPSEPGDVSFGSLMAGDDTSMTGDQEAREAQAQDGQAATDATPGVKGATEGATDGSKTSDADADGHIPGVLPDETEQPDGKDDEGPDLNADTDTEAYLAKHPEAKRVFDAFVARKEKGIQAWMQRNKLEPADLAMRQTLQDLNDPAKAEDAIASLDRGFKAFYGKTLTEMVTGRAGGRGDDQDAAGDVTDRELADADEADQEIEDALWNKEKPSEIKRRWMGEVRDMVQGIMGEIKTELAPVKQHFESEAQARQITATAESALTEIKQKHERAGDEWVTRDMVVQAIREFPEIVKNARTPAEGVFRAFRACHVDQITRKVAEYAGRGNGQRRVRELPNNASGTGTGQVREGMSFGEIAAQETVLG